MFRWSVVRSASFICQHGIFSLRAPTNGSVFALAISLFAQVQPHTHEGITRARTFWFGKKFPSQLAAASLYFASRAALFIRTQRERAKMDSPLRFLSLRRRRQRRQYKSIPYQNKMIYLRMEYILQIRPRRREMAQERAREQNDNVDQGLNVKSGREPRIITESANTRRAEKASEKTRIRHPSHVSAVQKSMFLCAPRALSLAPFALCCSSSSRSRIKCCCKIGLSGLKIVSANARTMRVAFQSWFAPATLKREAKFLQLHGACKSACMRNCSY
jgi:hypothetical protein